MPTARHVTRASSLLPALPIAPIVPEIPAIDAIFHPCIVAQRTTADLVVYMHDLGRVITVAYPLGPLGIRILPSGIFCWMERRGLVLECFCALVSSQPTPARFVDEFLSRHTVVRCHHINNQCGFYLDLMKIHMMTMFESPYERIPTLSFGIPHIPTILAGWRRLVAQDATLAEHPAPFVAGYFGIHVSIYPGTRQLRSGLSQPLAVGAPRRRASYHPYHHRRAGQTTNNYVAWFPPAARELAQTRIHHRPSVRHSPIPEGPSSGSPIREVPPKFSEQETERLDALRITCPGPYDAWDSGILVTG